MRWTWLFGVLAVAGCDDSFRRVGSGDDSGSPTTAGDDDDSGTNGGEGAGRSCDRRTTQGICEEYGGTGWEDASIEADCGASGEILLDTRCPLTDIGACDETARNPQGTIVYYYTGTFFTASDAGFLESQCTYDYNTWLPVSG
jgi:hypothetical protein